MKRAIYTSIFALGLLAIYALDLDVLSLQELMAQPVAYGTHAVRQSSRTFRIKGKGRLSLRTIQGAIRVRTRTAPATPKTIVVKMKTCYMGQKPLAPIDIQINGDDIRFAFRRQPGRWNGLSYGANPCGFFVSYDVIIPKGAELELHTVNGDIHAKGSEGKIRAQTVSGRITVHKSRETSLQTVSGEIELRDQKGDLAVTTVSGDMSLRKTRGKQVTLRAVSGQIKAEDIKVQDNLRCKNMSGSTRLLGLHPAMANTLKSMSGELLVQLNDKRGIRLSTKSFSGSVHSHISHSQTHPKGYQGPNKRLRLKSFSGSITVK